jgi:dienelactone hydrolase
VPLGYGAETVFPDHREVEVGFESTDGAVLSGTLILPRRGGRYPAIVLHFGSDRWTRGTFAGSNLGFWTENDIAVLTYDKRGVGRSQGECCPWRDLGYFHLLGQDVAAAAAIAATHPEVDAPRIGAWGFSQGGWVVPLAAAAAPHLISWMILGSGPAVSLGEELLYSELTGENECRPSGLPADEIERRLEAAGPSGYDPRPVLGELDTPGLWIYGGLDLSVPVARSVAVLDSLRAQGRDYTAVVIPRLNHAWILDGGICQGTGPGGIDGQVIASWLWPRLGREPPR